MKLEYPKVTFALWLVAMCALGFAVDASSVAGWTVVVGLGLLPLIITLPLWSDPPQSMSESIQEARR